MKWKPCKVPGCLRRAKSQGLCDAHLGRLRRQGSVQAEVPILAMNMRKWGTLKQILTGQRKAGS